MELSRLGRPRERGLGDMSLVPIFIQWPEHSLFGMPFYQRLNLWTMIFNSYFETAAENRPEGVKLVFRVSKVF